MKASCVSYFSLLCIVACVACGETAADGALREQELDLVPSLAPTLQAQVQSGVIPGAAVALVDDRGVLWSHAYGYENVARGTLVTTDTAFWLASVTKTVTGTAIVHAEEHGRLSLDANVSDLVEQRAGFSLAAPAGQPVTLRELVSHTSSVRDSLYYVCSYYVASKHRGHASLASLYPDLFAQQTGLPAEDAKAFCGDSSPTDLGGFLRRYLSADGDYYTPDNFDQTSPDAANYSNVGAALAGYAFGLATGASLADYTAANLFEPLQMTHTRWEQHGPKPRDTATPYGWDLDNSTHIELPFYGLATWPDGGLRSSANDLGRFLSMVIGGGTLHGKRVLKQSTVERMLTPIVSGPEGTTGVLWETEAAADGTLLVGHDGSDPGATTLMLFDPARRVGFVVLTNADEAGLPPALLSDVTTELLDAAALLHSSAHGVHLGR